MIFDKTGFATACGWVFAHCVDTVTGEYLCSQDVYVSVGTTLPAGAFLDEPPPSSPGFAVVRKGDEWQLVVDLRGQDAYNIQTRVEETITALGPLDSGWTLLAPSSPFDKWDGTAWVYDFAAAEAHEQATASSKRAALLAEANEQITYLSEAIDLGVATTEETAAHTAWRQYRVLLSRVDITKLPINWPAKPI